jgi:hypothetical protein
MALFAYRLRGRWRACAMPQDRRPGAVTICFKQPEMGMGLDDFRDSLSRTAAPEGLGSLLCALWYDAKGDWSRAHQIVQDEEGRDAAWVHAYLHRKEGDLSNASYWYRRAGKPACGTSLEDEWEDIAAALGAMVDRSLSRP